MNAMRCPISRWAILPLACLFLCFCGNPSSAWSNRPGAEAILISPDGRWVYVGNSASQAVEVIDTSTNSLVATVPIGAVYDVPGLAISPDGARLYVITWTQDVLVIDTAARKVAATVRAGKVGSGAVGLAMSADGKRLYVGNTNTYNVSMIDTATRQVVATAHTSSNPGYVALSPDSQRVYVASRERSSITILDAVTLQYVATIPVDALPEEMVASPDGKWVYLTHATVEAAYASHATVDAKEVDVIDTATNQVVARIKKGLERSSFLVGLAISPDGKRLYAGSSNYIWVIDAATQQALANVLVGSGPYYLAVSPDGGRVYVSNKWSRTVSVIDTTTLQVVATVKLGDRPTPP
jgi:YVTN family beta-propeller protein